MDLEEWEILPDDGFLQIHDDDGKMIFSRKYSSDNPKNEFNMNYFICPSPESSQFVDTTHQLVPLDPNSQETSNDQEKVIFPIEAMITKLPLELKVPNFGEHHDQFSQVFFKKMKENEFDNMKIDSPKSINKSQFEEKTEDFEVEKDEIIEENGNSGLNLLNKSLNGIGAICSFGVAAAATICIIFIGNHQKHKQNQKIRFQIFTDDKVKLEFPHEVLTCITGFYGPISKDMGLKVIKSLTFHTTRRKFGPFGEELGTYFTSSTTEGKVVGFHGRCGMYVDAIGVHMQHWLGNQRTSKNPLMKMFH